ncbi:MAG: hypothetical protein JSS34_02295 [Proteobacteria bacterium]|nr:hypothetical protein [Pseudomonadota bacterium]
MNRIMRFVLGIMTFLGLYASSLNAVPVIYKLIDSSLGGEVDQIRGVSSAIIQKFKDEGKAGPDVTDDLDLKGKSPSEFNFSRLSDLPKNNPEAIFISSGTYGIRAFRMLKESFHTEGIFVYVSHQIIGNEEDMSAVQLKSLVNVATFIVLPHHVFEISDPRAQALKDALVGSNTHLLQITGVVHNMHAEDLLKDYTNYKAEIPDAKKCMLVILGGDVEKKEGGTWTYYTPQEAEKLAQYVNGQMKEHPDLFVFVTNAPRTGRFDPRTGEDAGFHQKGGPLDPVTAAFMKALSNRDRVKLYNFEKGEPSFFKALLHKVNERKGVVLVPGESTSMISQVIDNTKFGSVILFTHGAMHEVHNAHVADEFKAGRVSLLEASDASYDFSGLEEGFSKDSILSSKVVADAIWEFIQEQKKKS